jgi:predicted O-methyltransferase YrrM
MNEVIRKIYATKKVQDAEGNDIDAFPVSIHPGEGELLYRLVRENNVKRSLETGMALGLSTLHICQALKDGGGIQHVSIDPWQERWFKNAGVVNLQRAGLEGLQRTLYCPSYEGLAELIRAGEPYDFAFIDGNHRFEYVLTDFFLADKILRTGAVVVFHDTWMPSIRKAATFILRNLGTQYELMPESVGAPPGTVKGLAGAARMMLRDPRDAGPALIFGQRAFTNTCVFRKISEPSGESTDLAWDFYRSF